MNKTIEAKCSNCPGTVIFMPEENEKRCRFCDTVNFRPSAPRSQRMEDLKYADERRLMGEFDEAEKAYRALLQGDMENDMIRWGLVLSRYGVVYEEDPQKGWMATCRRVAEQSILGDPDYQNVLKYAPDEERAQYEKNAAYIDEAQKEIKRLLRETEPYDIFLCYKETDENGGKTEDSKLVHGIYNQLKKTYRVFFAPETLKEKGGAKYEAAIYAAVERARVMLVIGTRKEYFTATWVRSEWTRFRQKTGKDDQKILIPVFRSADDLPPELKNCQGFQVDSKTLVKDLNRTLVRILVPQCPKCGARLKNFNGQIGWCPKDHWVSPEGWGFDEEAEEKNREDEIRDKRRRLKIRLAALITAAVLLAAAAGVFLLVVRPGMEYGNAAALFTVGDYRGARDGYSALGNYKDSLARVVLCDAMIALEEGRTEETVKKLDQLTADGMEEITSQLADALRPMIAGWRAKGLTPEAMLLLLTKADIIDPEGTLDIAALREQGHKALLDDSVRDCYTDDVNGDGQADLVALNADYSVTVYRMAGDRNTRLSVGGEVLSACASRFGDQFSATDENAAVACYEEAHRLLPNGETAAALTRAYRRRAAAYESAGETENALADAERAVALSGEAEDFAYYYELRLRYCQNAGDTAEAIARWERFGEDEAALLSRFGAQGRWKEDAAALHMARAAALAAEQDEGCVEELRLAAGLGADVSAAIAEAADRFETGMTRVRLQLLETELNQTPAGDALTRLAAEIRRAVTGWKELGISPADVPALIRLADETGVSLEGIDREACYREAALAAVGSVRQSAFSDWDGDGYAELLTLDEGGMLRLYGTEGTWKELASYDTGMPGCLFTIPAEGEPLLLALSKEEDAFLVLSAAQNRFRFVFRETGICRFRAEGASILFSRRLEGSLTRYNEYAYEAAGVQNRPVRTGIDWQQDAYPLPETPEDAIQRYLEALAYDIPEEAALLTAGGSVFPGIALDRSILPHTLETPVSTDTLAYCRLENAYLLKVDYRAGEQTGQFWATVDQVNGWKVTGLSADYVEDPGADVEAELLCLNEQAGGQISTRLGYRYYRLYVPAGGKVQLVWYGAGKNSETSAYHIYVIKESLNGEIWLEEDVAYQREKKTYGPLLLTPGVYYLAVQALIRNAPEYLLKMEYEPLTKIETENNDALTSAVPVACGEICYGILSSRNDVDWYSFNLSETSAVYVLLGTSGAGRSTSTAYTLSVLDAEDGAAEFTTSVAGNITQSRTGTLYLSAGSYAVKIARGSALLTDVYSVTVLASPASSTEAERNDTLSAANPIPTDTDITASVGREGDMDCYSFTLEQAALVRPGFAFRATDSPAKTYVLTILDESRNELYKENVGGKEISKEFPQIALPAGRYYIRVASVRFVCQEYTLRVMTQAVANAEKEPNKDESTATDMLPDRPYTGLLYTKDDVDCYHVHFTKQTSVVLKFSFTEGTADMSVFTVSIMQNGKVLRVNDKSVRWNVKENTGGFEAECTFPAGDYHIQVKPYNPETWKNTVYTLQISTQGKKD